MDVYKAMYLALFHAVTDALAAQEKQNFGQAAQLLRQGQQQAEEIFLNFEEIPEEKTE